jgi:hypothetical protein
MVNRSVDRRGAIAHLLDSAESTGSSREIWILHGGGRARRPDVRVDPARGAGTRGRQADGLNWS